MNRNREGYMVGDTHRECTSCGCIFELTSRMGLCKACNTARVKSIPIQRKMYCRAKARASARGLDFTIELSDVVVPEVCPVLGIPLEVNVGRSGAYRNSPSLDRINNSKGYIKGNVQVISQLANAMKGSATNEELVVFAKWVLSRYGTSAP